MEGAGSLTITRSQVSGAAAGGGSEDQAESGVADAGAERPWQQLSVQDNGAGFRPAAVEDRRLGLQFMGLLAEQLAGRIEITSTPGAGTEVILRFDPTARSASALEDASVG